MVLYTDEQTQRLHSVPPAQVTAQPAGATVSHLPAWLASKPIPAAMIDLRIPAAQLLTLDPEQAARDGAGGLNKELLQARMKCCSPLETRSAKDI